MNNDYGIIIKKTNDQIIKYNISPVLNEEQLSHRIHSSTVRQFVSWIEFDPVKCVNCSMFKTGHSNFKTKYNTIQNYQIHL